MAAAERTPDTGAGHFTRPENRPPVAGLAGFPSALQAGTGLYLAIGDRGLRSADRVDFHFAGTQMSVGMALFKKKADPLSERSRALNSEIAALEAQIKALDSKLRDSPTRPRLRSTARPHGSPMSAAPATQREPVFEPVNHHRLKAQPEPEARPAHFNELGVRRLDWAGAWRRLKNH